jgi:uncharacterized protein YozE (UPF0346 family)
MTTQLEAQQPQEAVPRKLFPFDPSNLSKLQQIPLEKLLIAGVMLYWAIGLIVIISSDNSISLSDPIIFYFPPAQQLLEGQGISAFANDTYHGPGYPVCLALTTLITGNMLLSSKLIAMVSALLYVFVTYLIARRLFSSSTAIVASLLLLNINTFLWISTSPGTDVPFATLALLSFYFMIRGETPTRLDICLAGAFAGIALTFRWTGQVLPLILVIRLLFLLQKDKASFTRAALLFGIYLAAFLICVGPWFYINYLLHGEMMYNQNGYNLDPNIFRPDAPLLFDALQLTIAESNVFEVVSRFVSNRVSRFPQTIYGFNAYPYPHGWVMAEPFWTIILAGALLILTRLTRLRAWLLLSTALFWVVLSMAFYEARSFIPVFFGAAIFIAAFFSEGFLPDVRLYLRPELTFRFDPGIFKAIFSRNTRARSDKPLLTSMHSGSGTNQAHQDERPGVSLIAVIFGAALFWTSFSYIQVTDEGHKGFTELHDIYRDISTYAVSENNDALLKPIAVRKWSPARYWIPSEANVPTIQFPTEDYHLVLDVASYLLFDQFNGNRELIRRLDDPQLAEIMNPARSPYHLEAVIYRQLPWLDVLYRILDDSHEASIASAEAAASAEDTEISNTYDGDPNTFWVGSIDPETSETLAITYALTSAEIINRIWLLPAADRVSFPGTVTVEVSEDNENWQFVISDQTLPIPSYQNPQILTFEPTSARYIRLQILGAETSEEGSNTEVSLAEIRIGQGIERPRVVNTFTIEAQDIAEASETSHLFYYEPDAALVAGVLNHGESAGNARVNFYSGESLESATYIGTGDSSLIAPGELDFIQIEIDDTLQFSPGECHPIWAVVESPQYSSSLPLDTFGMRRDAEPVSYFEEVCLSDPLPLVFYQLPYASRPAWSVPEEGGKDHVRIVRYDPDVDDSVMEISSQAETGQSVIFPVQSSNYEDLSMQLKTSSDFIIEIDVSDQTGEHYTIQYTTREDLEAFNEDTVVFQLTESFLDSTWKTLLITLYDDVSTAIKRKKVKIESITFHTSEMFALTDLKLTNTETE